VKTKTQLELCESSIKDEKVQQADILKNKTELLDTKNKSQQAFDTKMAQISQFKQNFEDKSLKLKKMEELLQTLSVGLAANEGQDNGFLDQLKENKKLGALATSEIEQIKMQTEHLKKELQESMPKLKIAEKQNATFLREIEASQKMLQSLQVGFFLKSIFYNNYS
jgi:structural maintenance of chromosome 2